LSNSKQTVIDAIYHITGISPIFIQGDVTNREDVHNVFKNYTIDGVIHFAAKKAV
jgi:UDP-glucose 4-epimerase